MTWDMWVVWIIIGTLCFVLIIGIIAMIFEMKRLDKESNCDRLRRLGKKGVYKNDNKTVKQVRSSKRRS